MDKPWAAVDPATGEVYVAYVDDFTGGATFLQNSTDQGQHWSPPVQVSTGLGNMRGVELGVDPHHAVDALWVDQNTGRLFFARSTDRGASFASQTRVATALETTTSTIAPAGQAPLFPALGVGTALAPGGRVPLYAVWQNGSGGASNDPEIDLSSSITNGTTWSSPTRVNSILSLESFEPSVTVASDGTVYVVWYAMDPASGVYRFVGAVSHDRGRTFGPQFNISDLPSETRYAAIGYDLPVGDNTDIVPEGTGARPIWTDARSPVAWNVTGQAQLTYVVNSSLYTALLVNDSIASSVPTNISVAGGVPDTGPLPIGPVPTSVDWVAGASYTLTAPNTTTWNGSTWSFAYWYADAGLNSSAVGASRSLNGTAQPDRHLTACYVPSAGQLCQGGGAPGLVHISVHPSFATAELDGAPITLLSGGASLLEPPGKPHPRGVGHRIRSGGRPPLRGFRVGHERRTHPHALPGSADGPTWHRRPRSSPSTGPGYPWRRTGHSRRPRTPDLHVERVGARLPPVLRTRDDPCEPDHHGDARSRTPER